MYDMTMQKIKRQTYDGDAPFPVKCDQSEYLW